MARKKLVRATKAEKRIIEARLQRRYPQMYEPALTPKEKKAYATLSPVDRRALEEMVGKRLKKLYRTKK